MSSPAAMVVSAIGIVSIGRYLEVRAATKGDESPASSGSTSISGSSPSFLGEKTPCPPTRPQEGSRGQLRSPFLDDGPQKRTHSTVNSVLETNSALAKEESAVVTHVQLEILLQSGTVPNRDEIGSLTVVQRKRRTFRHLDGELGALTLPQLVGEFDALVRGDGKEGTFASGVLGRRQRDARRDRLGDVEVHGIRSEIDVLRLLFHARSLLQLQFLESTSVEKSDGKEPSELVLRVVQMVKRDVSRTLCCEGVDKRYGNFRHRSRHAEESSLQPFVSDDQLSVLQVETVQKGVQSHLCGRDVELRQRLRQGDVVEREVDLLLTRGEKTGGDYRRKDASSFRLTACGCDWKRTRPNTSFVSDKR